MNEFIKLHTLSSNSTAVINVKQIITAEKEEEGTHVYCTNDNSIIVHESPEKIYSLIYESK